MTSGTKKETAIEVNERECSGIRKLAISPAVLSFIARLNAHNAETVINEIRAGKRCPQCGDVFQFNRILKPNCAYKCSCKVIEV